MQPLLEMKAICKNFGSIQALQNVDFSVFPGEVMALLGDNGAGKSTLVKIMSGIYKPDSGSILMEGQPVQINSPRDARKLGIQTVYQDLALCENLSITANLFLGRETTSFGFGPFFRFLAQREMDRVAEQVLSDLKVNIGSVRKEVRYLSGGQRQAVALSRAVHWGSRLINLDEPTAALGVKESGRALELIRELRNRGIAIVLISHNMEHVFQVADRITVLRQGRLVGTKAVAETSPQEVVAMITGAVRAAS